MILIISYSRTYSKLIKIGEERFKLFVRTKKNVAITDIIGKFWIYRSALATITWLFWKEHSSNHVIPSDFAKNFLADRCLPSLSGFTRLFSSIRLTRFSNPLKRPIYPRWQTWPRSLEIDTDFEITLSPTGDYRERIAERIDLFDRSSRLNAEQIWKWLLNE